MRTFPAHGRKVAANLGARPYISRPRAVNGGGHQRKRVPIPPTGGKWRSTPAQTRTDPAHGQQVAAKPQAHPYISRPRAASGGRRQRKRVPIPPTGSKWRRNPRPTRTFPAHGQQVAVDASANAYRSRPRAKGRPGRWRVHGSGPTTAARLATSPLVTTHGLPPDRWRRRAAPPVPPPSRMRATRPATAHEPARSPGPPLLGARRLTGFLPGDEASRTVRSSRRPPES